MRILFLHLKVHPFPNPLRHALLFFSDQPTSFLLSIRAQITLFTTLISLKCPGKLQRGTRHLQLVRGQRLKQFPHVSPGLNLRIKLKVPHKATPGNSSVVGDVASVSPSHEGLDDHPDLTNPSRSEVNSFFIAPDPKIRVGGPANQYGVSQYMSPTLC